MNVRMMIALLVSSLGIVTGHESEKNSIKKLSPIAEEINQVLSTNDHIKKIVQTKDPYFRSLLTLIDKTQALEHIDSAFTLAYKHFFYNLFHGPMIETEFPDGLILLKEADAPQLHNLVDALCTQLKIEKPLIFLTASKKDYNACASSLTTNTSLIVIGQKLISKVSEQELKAVLAHELSHIKKSHVPKRLLCTVGSLAVTAGFAYWLTCNQQPIIPEGNTSLESIPQTIAEFLTTYTRYPIVKIGLFGVCYIAYELYMMHLSQQYETEADILAIETTKDPHEFYNMIETLKNEIHGKLKRLEKEYTYVKQHVQQLEKSSPSMYAKILSDAKKHYDSMNDHFNDILDGKGSTHPSLEARQKIAKNMMNMAL